jgi:hypothetical protein
MAVTCFYNEIMRHQVPNLKTVGEARKPPPRAVEAQALSSAALTEENRSLSLAPSARLQGDGLGAIIFDGLVKP